MDPSGLMRVALLLQVCLTVVFCLPAFGIGQWAVGGALLASAAAFLAGRFGRGKTSWPAWGAALLLLALLPLTLTGEFPLPPFLLLATPAVALGWLFLAAPPPRKPKVRGRRVAARASARTS